MDAMNADALAEGLRGPEPFDELMGAARGLPVWWRDKSPADGFVALRRRFQFTQDEVAERSGLAQSLLSRLEGGGDARLSTWRRAYAAMGFELLLLPVCACSARELEAIAEARRPPGSWIRQRARPRPHGVRRAVSG